MPRDLIIVSGLVYMLLVPGLALLRRWGRGPLQRLAQVVFSATQRLGIHQSWVMFTGGPLDRSRELLLRFEYASGRHATLVTGLDALPPPHQAYVQHWLASSKPCREAVVDAVLEHLELVPDEEAPQVVSVVMRGRIVSVADNRVRRDDASAIIASAALEVETR